MDFEPDPRIVEVLARLKETEFTEHVWKHTLPGQPVDAENTHGARWNPAGVPARYYALDRPTALAEGNYLASVQPQPIRGVRIVHELSLHLDRVVDLRERSLLRTTGVSDADLSSSDHGPCRAVGGAAEWLGLDGLIVPSARSSGANLVVFERRTSPLFEAVEISHDEL
jgi:RES domain-containing protein